MLCEPAMMMTNRFEVFGEKVAECDWYLLPIKMQRMYCIFLLETQSPIVLCSYGGITCERNTSKLVLIVDIHNSYIYIFQ